MILLQKNFHRNNLNCFQAKITFKYILGASIKKFSSNNNTNKSVYYNFKLNFLNQNIKLQSITLQLKKIFNGKFLKHVKLKTNCFRTLQNGTLMSKNNFSAFINLHPILNFKGKYSPIRKRFFDLKSKKYNSFKIKNAWF